MARRSDNPSPAALRKLQHIELREAGFAFTATPTNGAILAMLVRRGRLPKRDWHTDVEIEQGLFAFLLDNAGEPVEKTLERVSKILARRWQTPRN